MSIWSSINWPTVICLPIVCYFLREATSETYDPRVYSLSYLRSDLLFAFEIYFLFAFIFRSINTKIQKYLVPIFIYLFYLAYPRDLFIQSTTILPIFLPVRHWQPLSYDRLQVFVLCVQDLFTWCCVVLVLVRLPWSHHGGKYLL